MQRRTALVLAVVTAGAAVGIVSADLVWNLNVRVEAQTDSGWKTLFDSSEQRGKYDGPFPADCAIAGRDMRLTIDNDQPLPDTVEIRIHYYNDTSGSDRTLFEDTWSLDAFETRTETLTIPLDALQERSEPQSFHKGGNLNIEYDRGRSGYYRGVFGFCVEEAS